MAGEWRSSTWGEEISLEYGKALRDYDKASGKYRVYGSNGPIGWTDKPLASGPGVILGRKGAYRGIEFSRAPFFVIDTAYYVVPKSDFDMRWLYYAIKHHKLGEIDDGSPIPSTTRSAVYVRDFDVPPIAEQKAIAAVLGALDDKIELNRRMNATLEAMARALFQSWFVDFDPVRAKLDSRTPAVLDLDASALFPEHLEETALGHTPNGWEVRSLDEIAHFLNGLALQKYPPGDGPTLPVIKIAQLRKGDSVGAERCNTDLPPRYIVQDGDVLFSWSGSLEVKLWCGGTGALNQHLFKVTSPEFPKWFYYFWTLYHLDKFRLIAADKATTMGHIQRGDLTAAKVLIPPRPLLDALTRTMSPLIDQIIANRIQSRTLATLRDTLLPKLLSGEPSLSKTQN
jgi:type I restriction enzyme S subunit